MIAAAAPALRFARFRTEIDRAIASVLDGETLILGPCVTAFEQRFAAYAGCGSCVGVNSGTDAVELALRACGIAQGDEVITASMTAAGTGMGILRAGATLRLVDVEPASRCIDPAAVAAAIGPRTAAIVPVHLHGHVADMPAIMKLAGDHGLAVVEDCAQAAGATHDPSGRRAGTFGSAAAFSFYPTKSLGCLGDGGAVVTSDPAVAARLRALRSYGWEDERRVSATPAGNSRLDELQAAVLCVMLDHLDAGNRERAAIAATYRSALADAPIELPGAGEGCAHHQFAVVVAQRDRLRAWLHERGVGTLVHYPRALHEQPAFADCAGGEAMPERLISTAFTP